MITILALQTLAPPLLDVFSPVSHVMIAICAQVTAALFRQEINPLSINCCQYGCVNSPISCNDNNPCTNDTCAAASGCAHTNITCNDNTVCTTDSCSIAVRTKGWCPDISRLEDVFSPQSNVMILTLVLWTIVMPLVDATTPMSAVITTINVPSTLVHLMYFPFSYYFSPSADWMYFKDTQLR